MTAYFDCNSTTPLDPHAREAVLRYLDVEFGNSGSRTHDFGVRALRAVNQARAKLTAAVDARSDEIIFTSGATESNNLALLGLAPHGEAVGKKHIVTSAIEHKAVLEPCAVLESRGFEVTYIPPESSGAVDAARLLEAVRSDTLCVSLMHVNNETGIIQPIEAVANGLLNSEVLLHVDAAQSFGKLTGPLRNSRIQLISLSAHKLGGPKGIGALIARRGKARPPLTPLLHGGGQERGLRAGTLPVHLIAGFAAAAEAALGEEGQRTARCRAIKDQVLEVFGTFGAELNGDPQLCLSNAVNLSLPGLDSEAVMLSLKDIIAISNGSACTSTSYQPSHVLLAMGLSDDRIEGAIRLSWCHDSEAPQWGKIAARLRTLQN